MDPFKTQTQLPTSPSRHVPAHQEQPVTLLPTPRGPGREPQATQLSRPGRSRRAAQETTKVQTEAACPSESKGASCSSPQLPPGRSPPGGRWALAGTQAMPGPTQERGLVTLPSRPHQPGTQSCHGGRQTSSSRESQGGAHGPPNQGKQGRFRVGGGYQKGPARSHVPSH